MSRCAPRWFLLLLMGAVPLAPSAWAQGRGPMPVEVAAVIERDIPPTLEVVGTIQPDRSAVVATEIAGLVASFEAEEGDFLEPGAVICRIDPTVARLKHEEAVAALRALEARLAELEAGVRQEERDRLAALVEEAGAIVRKWEYEHNRINRLAERGQSSEKEQHDVELEYHAARERLAQARAQHEQAKNGTRPEVLARARQEVAAQQARVAMLQRDLDKTEIRAPFAGALVVKRTEVGEWIDEGGAVCELVALDVVRVRLDVPERAIPFARGGASATVVVDTLGRNLKAPIRRVIPQANSSARTFPVEIDLENADHALLPGMFVRARVPAGHTAKRLMVSKDALVTQGTRHTIYVIRQGDDGAAMAVPVAVSIGIELGGLVAIEGEGLKPRDQVVVRANERLRGSTPVTPVPRGELTGNAGKPRSASADGID